MRTTRDTVVIGGSAGAVDALRGLLSRLPEDFPAAVLVVVHRAPVEGTSTMWGLSRAGPLPVREAVDGEPLQPGVVFLAPADRHLRRLLPPSFPRRDRAILVGRGPIVRGTGAHPGISASPGSRI